MSKAMQMSDDTLRTHHKRILDEKAFEATSRFIVIIVYFLLVRTIECKFLFGERRRFESHLEIDATRFMFQVTCR